MLGFIFESVGGGEWLVLLAVILIVVGPKNLPSAARKMGKVMSQLRRAADEFKRQLMTMDEEVRSTVDQVKQDYISTVDETSKEVKDTVEQATAEADRAYYEANPDAAFGGDNPYPGHGADAVYPDGTSPADYASPEEVIQDVVADTGVSEPTPPPAEPPTPKITVSPAPKGGKA